MFSGDLNTATNSFITDSINESHNKISHLNKIKSFIDRSKGTITNQNKLIKHLYNSLIQNHIDIEGAEYVRKRLIYNSNSNSNPIKPDDIYADYIKWKQDTEVCHISSYKNKKEFINFLNTIFIQETFGRDETYIAYSGVSFKRYNYLEGNIEDELDGTIYYSSFS